MSGQRRPRIERRKTPLEPEEVVEMETTLRKAVRDIQKEKLDPDFNDLYVKAHTLLLHREAGRMYNTFREGMAAHLKEEVQLAVESAVSGRLLDRLWQAWQDHHTAVRKMKNILIYPEPVYVHGGHAVDVYGLGLLLFRDCILHHPAVSLALRTSLLDMVAQERRGEKSDRQLMKNMCQMLLDLSIDNDDVYREDFERPLLKASRAFYRAESKRLLQECPAPDYLQKVERRISEETELAQLYLHPTTRRKLTKVVDDELIKYHMTAILEMEQSGLVHMLDNDKLDDLARVYRLFHRVDGGLLCLVRSLSTHLNHTGYTIVQEEERMSSSNAVQVVQALLNLRDQYDGFLATSFQKDNLFGEHIDREFDQFLNYSGPSPRAAGSITRTVLLPEYLSLFLDDLFKKGAKGHSEQEVDTILDKCIVLFRFFTDRDLFEDYYKKHLQRRLLGSKSHSDDFEKSMISKLKAECGSVFTRNLEGMLKDITLSATTMENYKKNRTVPRGEIELGVRVLTMSIWSLKHTSPSVVVPTVAQTAFTLFRQFYLEQYSGRLLTLQSQLGNADIHATFHPKKAGEKKKHIFQMTTHQMCVLMIFNRRDTFTVKELREETGIPREQLVRVLQSLSLGKQQTRVLLWTSRSEGSSHDFSEDERFTVNEGYTSRLVRVKLLPIITRRETDPERKETRKKIDDNRHYEIQATIVRVMKARKKLQHSSLMAECLDQLKSRFRPDPVMVKREIETLIERDYLQRAKEDKNVYEYQA